jgi:hypothetical protein
MDDVTKDERASSGERKGAGDTSQHDAIQDNRHAPKPVIPDARDYKAADILLNGNLKPQDALLRAGFPQSVARMGMYAVNRSKSLRLALMTRMLRLSQIPMPDASQRAQLIRSQLLVNMLTDKGASGSNAAAKLLGMDKEVNMFVSEQQQGSIIVNAPGGNVSVEQNHGITIDASQHDSLMQQDLPEDAE